MTIPGSTGWSNETILFDATWRTEGQVEPHELVARIAPTDYTVFPDRTFSTQFEVKIDADLAIGRANSYPKKRKAAYDDLVRTANAAVLNDWLYRTPYSLIASPRVKGLNAARDVGFGNYEPKTWYGGLWLSSGS